VDDTLFNVRDGTGALVRADQPWGDAQLASLYDAFPFDADVPLYLELARAEGDRVLEIGCGSGRLTVPLAEAGLDVTGIDISPHMLALARAKLQQRAVLKEADMRTFDVRDNGPFDLAIVPVRSFNYLVDRRDQARTLQRIAEHLRPRGLLALDLLHPSPAWVGQQPGSMRDDLLHHWTERGVTVSRVESVVSTDLAEQIRVIRSAYEIVDEHGSVVTKRFVEWRFRYLYRFEAEHLLERAGFVIEHVYGGYQREPFTSASSTMLFLARNR
jgi:SAM-dependent methyltransferase